MTFFLEKKKIAKITPSGNTSFMTIYRPISVLPYFSKMLESIMDNRLYKYLTDFTIYYTVNSLNLKMGHSIQSMQFCC